MNRSVISVKAVNKTFRVKASNTTNSGWLRKLFPVYEEFTALRNIDMNLQVGECLGILGPNGAGKSTLIKILCGLQLPSDGNVMVIGQEPYRRGAHFLKQIGIVFGHKSSLWWDLPVIDSFEAARILYDIPRERYQNNLQKLTRMLNLEKILDRPVRVLSLGERVKAEIVVSLLHDPKLFFLDEPTIGLDITSKAELRDCLRTWVRDREMAILLTSHDVSDIEQCCDRVSLIHQGSFRFTGTIQELRSNLSNSAMGTGSSKDSLEEMLVKRFQEWHQENHAR